MLLASGGQRLGCGAAPLRSALDHNGKDGNSQALFSTRSMACWVSDDEPVLSTGRSRYSLRCLVPPGQAGLLTIVKKIRANDVKNTLSFCRKFFGDQDSCRS
jgi:hypothetical protein